MFNLLYFSFIPGNNKAPTPTNTLKSKQKGIDDDILFFQAMHNSRNGENNTVVDDINIVEQKVYFDHWLNWNTDLSW